MTHLKEGDAAPDFSFNTAEEEKVSLKNFAGKKLILYFYPKDNTPTCTVEACNLRDHYDELVQLGFDVIGVSADSEKSHQNFKTKHNLPFPLLADTEKKLIESYGVWGEKKMMGRTYMGIHRVTFVINESGRIEKIYTKVKSKEHTEQILADFR